MKIEDGWGPARCSTKQLLHYGQVMKSGKFQKWDYGSAEENQTAYSADTPPELDLASIKLPIAMFVGKQDTLATPDDCTWAKGLIQSVEHYQEMDDFDHSCFGTGKDMSYFDKAMELIKAKNAKAE